MSNNIAIRKRLATDLEYYAKHCLKIKTKEGRLEALFFNKAQKYIHEQLEKQLAETGKVRALVVKGRQQGCSTYVGARYYHKTTNRKGRRTFILTHLQDSTDALFDMVQTFEKYSPDMVKPSKGAASAKELYFDKLESGYKVGTAGSGEVGRGTTVQLMHGSEVAHWKNSEKIASGLMQAVSDSPDTEIILESTANGIGDYFHKATQGALRGENDFIVIFVPWFWTDEYRAAVPDDFVIDPDEQQIIDTHGLELEQLTWRRKKIAMLPLGVQQFKQEYPSTIQEAFQASNQNSYIPMAAVEAAGKTILPQALYTKSPLILGCDPAHEGKDRTVIYARQGRKAWLLDNYQGKRTDYTANRVAHFAKELEARAIMIDKIGVGAGVYDQVLLHFPPDQYPGKVIGVNSSDRDVFDPERFFNRRAEMWGLMRDWILDSPCQIEDNPELIEDLVSLGAEIASNGSTRLESKDKLKARGFRSPDHADALALTFAFPVPTETKQTSYYVPISIV